MHRRSSHFLILFSFGFMLVGCRGNDTDTELTLERCQDLDWLTSTEAGRAELEAMRSNPESTCNNILAEEAMRICEGLEEEEVAVPRALGGGTANAKIVPNPDDGLDEVEMPLSLIGYKQNAAITATEEGLSAEEQALRDQWDLNENRVESCREYAFEKYYDYARFEDAVAGQHDDFEHITELAFGDTTDPLSIGSRTGSGERLNMKDGTDMTVQHLDSTIDFAPLNCHESGYVKAVHNIFFGMPSNLLDQEPDLRDQVSLGCEYHPIISLEGEDPSNYFDRTWQWHQDRRQAAIDADLSMVEMDAMHESVLAFQQTLFDYYRNRITSESVCCAVDPMYCGDMDPEIQQGIDACFEEYRAERTSLEARLNELFDLALEMGCIDLETPTICDWSPQYFVERIRMSFGSAMEADYQRCLEVTGDDFEPLINHEFTVEISDWPGYPAEDYTVTASSIDLYISRRQEWLEAYREALPPELFDASGNPQTPSGNTDSNFRAGNEDFGVFYNYSLHWSSTNYDPSDGINVCDVGLEASGSATAGGSVFASGDQNILDAYFSANLTDGFDRDLKVLDQSIWEPNPDEGWMISGNLHHEERPLAGLEAEKRFVIAGIPMSITGGIAGTLNLDYNFHLTPASSCSEPSTLNTYFLPSAQIDGYIELAVDAFIASVGIGGALTLLRLDVPFDVRTTLSPFGGDQLNLEVETDADLILRALDGRIYVFLEIDLVFWSERISHDIFTWAALRDERDLFHSVYTVDLGILSLL